jgi:hypothetical protein
MSGAISAGTLATIAGIGAAGSIGGALISSNAAGNAASTQAQAADNAAQLQYQASQNALGFQEQQYNQNQQNLAPWLQSGASSLTNLDYLLGLGQPSSTTPGTASGTNPVLTSGNPLPGGSTGMTPIPGTGATAPSPINLTSTPNTNLGAFGSLMQAYPGGQFQAPTEQQFEQSDPGYQARLKLGLQAEEQSAAARGNVLTGGTLQAENQLAQDYASNEYNNAYNRAYNTYSSNYNQFQQQQANQFNRLASLAGVGQQTASTLGTLGQNAANTASNTILGTAANMGQQYNNAAAANASGMVASGNDWGGALSGSTGNFSNLLLLSTLKGMNGGAYGSGLFNTPNELSGGY